ncbi:MAG: EAL domain-containing protein, partial [Gammaproteobacteria bacterium]|nr:EAL domain-containing protein [Gammaproteobacteria bacterium]
MSNKPTRILVIDDEQSVRTSVGDFLEDCDYQVLQAENGRVGLEICGRENPDLVLTDLRMPVVDGLEVLDEVTRKCPDIPVIVISGTGYIGDVVEALRLGAWDYILKPIEDLSVLDYAVEKAMEKAHLIYENRRYREHLEDAVEIRTAEIRQAKADIERTAAEEQVLGMLLRLSLEPLTMHDYLRQVLETLLKSVPWLSLLPKGAILLSEKEGRSKVMELIVTKDLSPELHTLCARVPYGKCLCGRAAQKREIQFSANCDDPHHETRFDGMPPHGHYNVPILHGRLVFGVLALYLPPDHHAYNRHEEAFLERVADVLSMGISRRYADAKIEHHAYHDTLTGLPNRELLLDRLRQNLAATGRNGTFGALLYLDLDHFKTLNDSLGHPVGDRILRQVAKRINEQVRTVDTVARLGGDEFLVLLPELSTELSKASFQAQFIAGKLRTAISRPYNLRGHKYQLTVSTGIVLHPIRDELPEDILKQGANAMYRAKTDGRNAIRYYLPSMQEAADSRLALEEGLRLGLERQEFALHYQPQVDATGRIIGAEALLRWEHPGLGQVSPVDFIPIAEETGLILSIGEWVLRETCRQFKAWTDEGVATSLRHLAVNVSPREFRQYDFVAKVEEILGEYGIEPSSLDLEITEGVMVDNVDDIVDKMRTLKDLGVSFSMDDFGTGYSSLAYLKRL